MPPSRVLLGVIGRPHGVRGLLRVQSFTAEPEAIAAYGPLTDEAGTRSFRLEIVAGGEMPLVRIEGVADRDAAARLTGTRLYVERSALPPPGEEEYYLADLVGCCAVDEAGGALGTVIGVHDHGAGAFLEIARPGRDPLLVPFTRASVPGVDLAGRRLTVSPPVEEIVPPSRDALVGTAEGAAA